VTPTVEIASSDGPRLSSMDSQRAAKTQLIPARNSNGSTEEATGDRSSPDEDNTLLNEKYTKKEMDNSIYE